MVTSSGTAADAIKCHIWYSTYFSTLIA